jgi:hypothetical protein
VDVVVVGAIVVVVVGVNVVVVVVKPPHATTVGITKNIISISANFFIVSPFCNINLLPLLLLLLRYSIFASI